MSSLQLQHTKYCIFWLKQPSLISDEHFPEYYETRKAKYFSLLLFWWHRTRLLNLSKENCFGNNLERHYTWLLDTATHRLFTFPLLHKDPCYRRAISSSIKKDEMKALRNAIRVQRKNTFRSDLTLPRCAGEGQPVNRDESAFFLDPSPTATGPYLPCKFCHCSSLNTLNISNVLKGYLQDATGHKLHQPTGMMLMLTKSSSESCNPLTVTRQSVLNSQNSGY